MLRNHFSVIDDLHLLVCDYCVEVYKNVQQKYEVNYVVEFNVPLVLKQAVVKSQVEGSQDTSEEQT